MGGRVSPPLNSDPRIKTLSLDQRTLSWLVISLAILPIHPQLSFQEPRNPWPLVATRFKTTDALWFSHEQKKLDFKCVCILERDRQTSPHRLLLSVLTDALKSGTETKSISAFIFKNCNFFFIFIFFKELFS